MASLWLARASSQLARRAAARRPPPRPARHGSGQPTSSWFLGSVPQAALGSPALDTSRRGFCSVRRFAGESSAAAAAAAVVDEEPESGFAAGDQQVCVDQTSSWIDSELLV
jgi:2-oxoisovalerate dehydrogenase E1 component alpha subunit